MRLRQQGVPQGQDHEVADIEIPVAIPPFDDQIRFAPIAMSFPRPPPDPGGDSHGDSHGYTSSDSDSDTPTSGDEDTVAGSGTTGDSEAGPETIDGSAGGAGAGGPGDEGCACDVRTPGRGPAALLWLALLGLRRRRA